MKQIPFTLDAFGPDGMLKEGEARHSEYGTKAIFVKKFDDRIVFVFEDGLTTSLVKGSDGFDLSVLPVFLYRRTRTAEEVARDVRNKWIDRQTTPASWVRFDDLSVEAQRERLDLVQAGMDEMQ